MSRIFIIPLCVFVIFPSLRDLIRKSPGTKPWEKATEEEPHTEARGHRGHGGILLVVCNYKMFISQLITQRREDRKDAEKA